MLKQTTVLFTWDVSPELKRKFRKTFPKIEKIKLLFPGEQSPDKIIELSKSADVIVGWRSSPELLESAKNLKLFINPGTGIKHHLENFRAINRERKLFLVNGHGHAFAVAQHTVAMLLALMNRIVYHHNLMKEGKWETSDDKDISLKSILLRNRKIGLLGYGAINKNVHRFLSGFKNEFHILKRDWNPAIVTSESSVENGESSIVNNEFVNLNFEFNEEFKKYEPKDLNKFLKSVDILIIAIPLTSNTEGMIGKKELKILGKNSLLVNIARGPIVDEESLYEALKRNEIGGAALDVWYNYKPKKDKKGRSYPFKFPFHDLNNVLMSPHRAASPFDELNRWDEVIENIRRAVADRKDFLNIVDLKKEY